MEPPYHILTILLWILIFANPTRITFNFMKMYVFSFKKKKKKTASVHDVDVKFILPICFLTIIGE